MRRLRDQIGLSLAVALVFALMLGNADANNARGRSGTQPYRTHRNMLLVSFTVYRDRPPEIQEVDLLPEGRITVQAPGENHYRLEAADGAILYEQAFVATFFLTTDPPLELDEVAFTVVMPNLKRAERVVVVTPWGEAARGIRP